MLLHTCLGVRSFPSRLLQRMYFQVYHSLPLHLYSGSLMLLLVSSVVFVHDTISLNTDTLIGLQWLLIAACIEFKLCLLVCSALNGLAPNAPSYITA